MNFASGVTATPSISAAGAVPAYGLSTTGGSARIIAVATPAAPSSATPSPTGSTSYWYWLVAEDRNGFRTLPSASRNVTNGPATLGGGNQITVNFANVAGAVKFYVLRTTSSTAPTGTSNVLAGTVAVTPGSADNAALSLVDTTAAASLTSFTAPTRNNTADLTVDGIIGGGGQTTAILAADATTTNTTATAVSGLSFTAGANETWTFDFIVRTGSSSAAGMKLAIDVPTGATLMATVNGTTTGPTASATELLTADATLNATPLNTAGNQNGVAYVSGTVVNGSTAGTVSLMHAKVTSGTSTVAANSSMVARRVA
jgi:hypothetical protein